MFIETEAKLTLACELRTEVLKFVSRGKCPHSVLHKATEIKYAAAKAPFEPPMAILLTHQVYHHPAIISYAGDRVENTDACIGLCPSSG